VYINKLGMPYTPYSLQQSPSWKATRFSASQQISLRILWNPKFHYGVYRCLPPVPLLSQIKPALANPPPHFLTIHIDIIKPSTSGSSKWSLSHRFPDQTFYEPLPIRATCPAYLILLHLITRIISGEEYRSWISRTHIFIDVRHIPDICESYRGRGQLKCDGTRAETRFRLSPKRTSPFKTAGASVQSTSGSRGVRISGSNAGYIMFRGSVKSTGYPLNSPVSPSLPLPCVTVCHHISTGV
jgi:hypothetical protein